MSSSRIGRGHPHIDKRSLEMAKLVVARIETDQSLVRIAHENLDRWRRQAGGTLPQASREWEAILDEPWSEIRAILLDESDEGQRLRSSSPFCGIVTQEERRAIIAANPGP